MSHAAILILTIILAGDVPDKTLRVDEASIEDCWKDAKSFVEHSKEVLPKFPDAIGAAAACGVIEKGEKS